MDEINSLTLFVSNRFFNKISTFRRLLGRPNTHFYFMKTHVFLTCGLLSLALVSCKKELELKQGSIDKTGTLALCINSTLTGQKLAGASVVVVGSPKDSTVSDATGVARLRLRAGNYELKVCAEGYAPIYYRDVEIKPLNGESDTPIFGETHGEVDMYALGATLPVGW